MSENVLNPDSIMIEEVKICPICIDAEENNELLYVCRDTSHSGFHKDCLIGYIESKVNDGYLGICPLMNCPCEHKDKKRRILPYSTWKSISSPVIISKFKDNAESLLSFLCGNCHTLRSITVVYTEEDRIIAQTKLVEHFADNLLYTSLFADIESFINGELSVTELYQKLSNEYFHVLFTTGEDTEVWNIFKYILALIEDPERRANLHLRHLWIRPRMSTPCCQKEHCFRCRTKDFHNGKTCEENTNNLDSSIVPCPSCGVHLTKGDG